MMKFIKCNRSIRKILYSLFAVIFLLITIYPLSQVHCEYRRVKPEWVMPESYPEWFHGWGRIGYFEENELVINDMDYRVSPRATFHTPDDDYASRYIFTKGKMVGFLFDENGEIISLWLITKEL
ncbi:hypothetical protein ACFL6W_09195 [Thermodesulfobacteriota bacterium]